MAGRPVIQHVVQWVRRHRILLLVFVCLWIGTLHILPHLLAMRDFAAQGKEYVVVTPFAYNDEIIHIWPRFQKVFHGNWPPREIDLADRPAGPWSLWPIGTPLLLYPFYFLGDLNTTVIVAEFCFSIIIFLFLFAIARQLLSRFVPSLVTATIITLVPHIALLVFPPTTSLMAELIKSFLPFIGNFDPPQRVSILLLESYFPGFVFYGGALLFLLRWWITRRLLWGMLAGLAVGLCIYIYSLFWTYLCLVTGLLLIASLFQKNCRFVFQHVVAIGIAILVSLPYLYNTWTVAHLPNGKEVIERSLEFGRFFRWSEWPWYFWYVAVSGVMLWIGKKTGRMRQAVVLSACLLAGILALNYQLLTGVALPADHWNLRVLRIPLALAYVFVMWHGSVLLAARVRHLVMVARGVLVVLAVSVCIGSVHTQVLRAKTMDFTHTLPSGVLDSLRWLEDQTPSSCVVLSPSLLTNNLITAYTHCRIFVPRAVNTFATEQEITERWLIALRLFGMESADVERFVGDGEVERIKHEKGTMKWARIVLDPVFRDQLTLPESQEMDRLYYIFGARYLLLGRENPLLGGGKNEGLPLAYRQELVDRFQAMAFDAALLRNYRADYVYVGPQERTLFHFDEARLAPYVTKVYDQQGVTIYAINQQRNDQVQ